MDPSPPIPRLARLVIPLLVALATAKAATFSGRVTDGGAGVPGVRINYTWSSPVASGSGAVFTNSSGNWSSGGWSILTNVRFAPSQSGYSFSPTSRSVGTDVFGGGSTGGLNFSRISYAISGKVSRGSVGLSNVTVTLSGAQGGTTTTDANGNYSFTRLRTGGYTITPSFPGYSFTPANRSTSLSPSRTGQNFSLLNPIATTSPADEIGFGAAVVNGTIEGDGVLETSAWFEYGVLGDFSQSTEPQVFPAGIDKLMVTETLTGLGAGETYNYRMVASNDNGSHTAAPLLFVMPYLGAKSAAQFDGVNDHVLVGDNPALKMSSALTVEAWINPTGPSSTSADGSGIIVNREGEYEIGWWPGDETVRYAIANSDPGWNWINTGVVVPVNTWAHIAFTYDAGAPAPNVHLYLNGSLAYSGNGTGNIGDVTTGQNQFRIGNRQSGGGTQTFRGAIDEVRMWNIARSASEIEDGFRRRLGGDEAGLAGYWQFDEGVGTTTADRGPNLLNATLQSGAAFAPSGAGIRDPEVLTLSASPVLATRATLRGTVNPAGTGTVAYFEYGETVAYGNSTDPGDLGEGLLNVPASAMIMDLQPGTTYHYRCVSFNEFGTTYGEDQTFTTLVLGVGWPTSSKVTGGYAEAPVHTVDPLGNTYAAGRFSGSATFRNTLESQNDTPDGFVGKLGRGADWIWQNQVVLGANSDFEITSIDIDDARNVCVAGWFSGNATFGADELSSGGAADRDLFVAKLDAADGAWLWAVSVGTAGADAARGLAVTPSGGWMVAGHLGGSATFGTLDPTDAFGGQDLFVAMLDADGTWVWASSAGGSGAGDSASSVVVNSLGEAFVTGLFQGSAQFDSSVQSTTLTATDGAADEDLFVARISSDGEWLLARRGGSGDDDQGIALAIDAAGQLYLLGEFGGTADYNSTLTNLNSGNDPRLFVAKLNSNANMLWYSQAGRGTGSDVAIGPGGRVYVTGHFTISTSFGATSPISVVSGGNEDVFLAQLSADSGAWAWAEKIGSSGEELSGSVAVDAAGGVVVTGTFQNTVPVGYVLLATANIRDVFVARFDADAVVEHNTYVIGEAIPVPVDAQRPDGGAIAQPVITILEREHAASDELNSFVWSLAEHKLYPVRPVTAILKWPLTDDPTNTTSIATAVGRCVWPSEPERHVAGVPADIEPDVEGFPFRFLDLPFTTINGAEVDTGSKQFNASSTGWSVLHFLNTGGEPPNANIHPSQFEVVRTARWNEEEAGLLDNQVAPIGAPLSFPQHDDPSGRNGYVFFERAPYDGLGNDRAHDRTTRGGPIIPVNRDTPANDDDLVVVWFRTSPGTGIAWPSTPVRYFAQWPANPSELVLASGIGSGVLDPAVYPEKRVYNQPDPSLPGFNPNEEHAALFGDVLHALRNDLNDFIIPKASDPYTLLKYRDPLTNSWRIRVFRVVASTETYPFRYPGEAGSQLQLPAPLSLLPLCSDHNEWVSGPGFQDYQGRLYARAAGADGAGATIVARYWYPLQPGFFFDLDRDGVTDAAVGECVPWLDRRPGGTAGVPIDVSYAISWPDELPTLQVGETLINAKFGLPDLVNFAHAQVIFDEGDPTGTSAADGLVRLFDPLSPRVVQLRPNGDDAFITGPGYDVFRTDDPAGLFDGLATRNEAGKLVFLDLPFALRSRLLYDPLNHDLQFRGVLDESQRYGGPDNPLVLPNILSPREADRLRELRPGDDAFSDLVSVLYDLCRNPNHLDLDEDSQPDTALLIGLTRDDGRVLAEEFGAIPKALTAGLAQGSGYVTVVENNDPALAGLPVTLHILRVGDGPHLGDIKVVQSDNVFDEKLTLRHSADFAGQPQEFEFEWFYRPVEAGTDPSLFPSVNPDGSIADLLGWTQFTTSPPVTAGVNEITLGDGGTSSLLILADNYFICRYRGYEIAGETPWSGWIGIIGGGQAQLAEGWVKRVRDGLNPFEARTMAFHENETVTFASMLQQAGPRYEGAIAFNPSGGAINQVGLIEAYETVLRRAKSLSIEGAPPINYQPANDALLLAAGYIADLYFLLANEAAADATDPTIGFRTSSSGYGTLAPSVFAFQNQLGSLLEEELALLRGRDDSAATVRLPPVYNRLFWNFTRDEGEVAYAQAYNITDQNADGFIGADDARILFPQAHGDAWGHYLTATKTYYSLLQNPFFEWVPRAEPILLAGVPVEVDYLDERKFARAAAAKAKVGQEVVDLTYRLNYVDDPEGQFQGYTDTDPQRAWGVSEWAHRAASGALFDWAAANAVLPSVDPDPTHTGIEKIDRTTVPELDEIVSSFNEIQSTIDRADAGLNPLGIAKNSVPFDIDPAQIAAGKTHFEQIYDRAIEAVDNAVAVFDHANQLSQALRSLQDDVNDFSSNVADQERDYKNRLIELFGYPYAGDIGPGRTYPAGYDGPDLYHYMYVDTAPLNGETRPPSETFTGYFTRIGSIDASRPMAGLSQSLSINPTRKEFFFPEDVPVDPGDRYDAVNLEVEYPYTDGDFGTVAPASWGQRRAPGELQLALSEMIQNQARFKQGQVNYDNLLKRIEDEIELLEARYDVEREKIFIRDKATAKTVAIDVAIKAYRFVQSKMKTTSEAVDEAGKITVEGVPKTVGFSNDAFSGLRSVLKGLAWVGRKALNLAAAGAELAIAHQEDAKESIRNSAKQEIVLADFSYTVRQQMKQLEQLIREEPVLRAEVFALEETLNQSLGRYQAALAKGERLIDERTAFRKRAAADTQQSRYQDMTFRIFRNDAIQKYRAQFDLAARYVYLAAVAYDYDTQLLGGKTGAGREFLTDIVRQRALGEVVDGTPIAGRHGLADPLARLDQNFNVLKGQLGFNNPQTETGRFSLRRELFRLRDASGTAWREALRQRVVPDLWQVPEFRRHCRPFAPESAGPQPGLVVRFPTTVTFGLNYFGWPLGGGDSAYDSTLFATKVRSAGVWFSDYDGSGLSNTPRVYLVPAGADVMRSPSGSDLETREWRVIDQRIPVPFPIGFSDLADPAFIPSNDSLSSTYADIRRFSSFRAYHDSGVFDPSQTVSDSRLIGRSVWNTDWMLIIPGGTFLFDSEEGLEGFIDSVSDIKIFFQTYAYSGN